MKKLDIILALKKKQKIYIIIIKTKKKGTLILITIEKVKSKEDSDLIYKPENN